MYEITNNNKNELGFTLVKCYKISIAKGTFFNKKIYELNINKLLTCISKNFLGFLN